jgi:hypothetical protein
VPSITLICLSKGRIEGTDEVAKVLAVHALYGLLFGTEKDPTILAWIPKQRTLLLLFLVFFGTHRTTEWADELPFPVSSIRYLNSTIQIIL